MTWSLPRPGIRVLAVLLAMGAAVPTSEAAAQEAAGSDGDPVSVLVSGARAQYDRDPFCIDPTAWFTTFRLSVERGALGISAAYVAAYPWLVPPPPVRGAAFVDRGPAYQVGLHVDPLELIAGRRWESLGRFLTPFVGAGVQISTAGEAASPGVNGPEPTVALQGGTDPYVTYGARLTLPLTEGGLGIFGEVRGTSVFDGGKDVLDVAGERLESESATLTWAEFSVGIRLRLR